MAANQILIQFLHIFAYILDGFAFSAEVLVGISFGEKSVTNIRNAARICGKWAVVAAVCLSCLFFVFGQIIVAVMTNSPEVLLETEKYLGWLVLIPITSVAAYILDGIFFGSIRTREMCGAMFISASFYFLIVNFLIFKFGNAGLWLSLNFFLIARAVTLSFFYSNIERSVLFNKNS